jgi:hypothetical protein
MVVVVGRRTSEVRTQIPQELLESRYAVNRDEMLWREYNRNMADGSQVGRRKALSILREIREAPE